MKPQQFLVHMIAICARISEVEDDQRLELFEGVINLLEQATTERINLDEACRCGTGSGKQGGYHHNKYLVSVIYLFLGECYDFALEPDKWDPIVAKKYYTLSDQPPAKWRLAKLYADKRLRYDGDVGTIMFRLIGDAINQLTVDLEDVRCHKYFTKRFEYLLDMYKDLFEIQSPCNQESGKRDKYYVIVRWIIDHKQHVTPDHSQLIEKLCEYDVPCETPEEITLLDALQSIQSKL